MSGDVSSIHDLSYTSNLGEEISLAQFEGRPLLIVNTATKCGLAPQFKTLEQIHQEFGPQGLVLIGFPCGQFANQEPGNDDQIARSCELNFGVTFPLAAKIDVNGAHTDPVFQFLKSKGETRFGNRIKWNFTKFLVSPDGTEVLRLAPTSSPKQLIPMIRKWLPSSAPQAEPSVAAGTSPTGQA
ncbi:MAG: glutathione peroxidase [Solirubrobacteraceae bacterium]|nr:glutathione peroxidase [Solirubrobacteraceae bacterium]